MNRNSKEILHAEQGKVYNSRMIPHDFMHLCHTAMTNHGSMFATLFVAGLIGSVTHCVGMCGPFVLNQTATLLDTQKLNDLSLGVRLRGATLLPYHLGRLTTYVTLGVVASLLPARLRDMPWFNHLSAVLLVIAGVIFILNALPRLMPRLSLDMGYPICFSLSLKGLFAHPRGWRGYVLGVALGFLPCGFVYAAIISAAARGQPLTAALGMIGFALGTIPSLIAVGFCGQVALNRFRSSWGYALPILMILNSVALFVMAGELIK